MKKLSSIVNSLSQQYFYNVYERFMIASDFLEFAFTQQEQVVNFDNILVFSKDDSNKFYFFQKEENSLETQEPIKLQNPIKSKIIVLFQIIFGTHPFKGREYYASMYSENENNKQTKTTYKRSKFIFDIQQSVENENRFIDGYHEKVFQLWQKLNQKQQDFFKQIFDNTATIKDIDNLCLHLFGVKRIPNISPQIYQESTGFFAPMIVFEDGYCIYFENYLRKPKTSLDESAKSNQTSSNFISPTKGSTNNPFSNKSIYAHYE